MATQHSDKRIKLFLERSIERLPFDITQKAEEIYLPDGDPSEKLKRKVKAIVEIAGDNYDQFTENIASADLKQQDDKSAALATEKDDAADGEKDAEPAPAIVPATTAVAGPASAANTRVNPPQAIYAKLWHAQSEIGLALDVLNIIISSYQTTSGTVGGAGSGPISTLPNAPLTALPPGSLKCEYVPKAPLPLSALISNEKMALGGKKHQLRNAADILMQGAQKLKKVMVDEGQFWEGALRLRKNNWCIVSAKTGSGQQPHLYHGNRLASGTQLFVHYGFRDVGSLYSERAYAELVRDQSSSETASGKAGSIKLHIPNKTRKMVVMSLVQQGEPHTQGSRASQPKNRDTLHTQLLSAQNALFDNELFQELINEARTMNNSVSIVDNELFLPINDELELKIAHRTPTSEDQTTSLSSISPSSSQSSAHDICQSGYKDNFAMNLKGTAEILRCTMQLMQHRRYRQNIKERSDSFFKSSRPGGGRTAGSFGQLQQTLQQRPTAMLSTTLQVLQYYSFSKRIREALGKVTRNLRQNWWEPINVHSVDIKSPPQSTASAAAECSTSTALSGSTSRSGSNFGMGSAVSIQLGSQAPAVRFVMRSHPAPCVILQLSNRPSAPIMHVAEFERVLEQELAARAIGRICEVINSIETWSDSMPTLQSPRFVIDIDKRCVGVFQIPQRNGTASVKTISVLLQLDMKAERAISISLTCKQGNNTGQKQIFLEDQQFQNAHGRDASGSTIHPYDQSNSTAPSLRIMEMTMERFRTWLKQSIQAELGL
ncbi:subunit 17 of mediator complex-domain-containing protein [Gamsiella multidivaricata]|uniref:subunit 17 of mediator complex-domain-containing protein n=1 Tax=Gamsiella multidivaricata TaxID=101098 RepID=UPI002220CE0F|nr:subunit 17 of mediator complex-domain-containing protein [Gamsiella multidivaricata]KAI7822344.1 subunit 17 of mediator complex-domain-containing protein [Gamsiella multidivaricata]